MGTIYRRQVRVCATCRRRLDTRAAQQTCAAARHAIELREQGPWWIKYQVNGRPVCASSGSERKEDAKRLLRQREHLVDRGAPAPLHHNRVTFGEAADDLVTDYVINQRRSLRELRLRLRKHLKPYFGHRRLATISTADARAYTAHRLAQRASNGTVNRELVVLKRMCTLAVQAGKLLARPYLPLLKEHNVRQGFFEHEQFTRVKAHLPAHFRAIVEMAYITGWRTPSEILPLEWRQVDLHAGEVRLDPGTTKNGEARVFPLTAELRRVFEAQRQVADEIARVSDSIVRYVFCYTSGEKTGRRITESGFNKAWRKACVAAGCPGRIPHDCRRTAVRNLVRAGVPERVAMQLTGHKTRAVFERYNIVSPGDLRDAARRLDTFSSAVV